MVWSQGGCDFAIDQALVRGSMECHKFNRRCGHDEEEDNEELHQMLTAAQNRIDKLEDQRAELFDRLNETQRDLRESQGQYRKLLKERNALQEQLTRLTGATSTEST